MENRTTKYNYLMLNKVNRIYPQLTVCLKRIFYLLVLIMASSYSVYAQEKSEIIYKQIDTVTLKMEVIHPKGYCRDSIYPAIVFFHGGSWKHGNIQQFEPQAEYFSKRGMVCFLPEYRVYESHNTTPLESLKDAKSALRYIRMHAEEFRIYPDKIVGSGGSAGGTWRLPLL